MIDSIYQSLYEWKFEDNEEESYVTFNFPVTFNPESIKIELSENGENVLIGIPNKVPIVCGLLFGAAVSAKGVYTENKYVISITKKERGDWPILIKSEHQKFGAIDPKSATVIFHLIASQSHDKSELNAAIGYLTAAAKVGFLAAMQTLGGMLMEIDGKEQEGFLILKKAADIYNDPVSCYQVGVTLAAAKSYEEGINYLERSSSSGYQAATLVLGQIYSPEKKFSFPYRDAVKAMKYLESVTEADQLPTAYEEMALLYENGNGVNADVEKAKALRAEAERMKRESEEEEKKMMEERRREIEKFSNTKQEEQQANNGAPQAEEKGEEASSSKKLIIFGATAVIAGAFLYNMFKRAKKM